jgi:ubiquinol-cytochrome c reductase cytochrome b subunit
VGQWRNWVADRFGLKPIKEKALDRRVAKGSWYFGDGATLLLLLGVLVATGALMTLTYSPTPDTAYESVRYITEMQVLGWFIRGLHYWSAGLMVVMLFVHLFRQILLGGYKAPREGTWLLGVGMFFLVITMSFLGYLLRWDERSIYALRVALTMFHNVPVIGEGLVVFVQGGEDAGALTLTRLYSVHVLFVPLTLLLLVAFHVYLVIFHGVTSKSERDQPVESAEEQKKIYKADANSEKRGETFYPITMAKSGAMAFAVFALAVILTLTAGPAPLYPEANLVERSFPIEEWWFWWYSALIALLPSAMAPSFVVLFPILLFIVLVSLPFLDRGPNRGIRRRPIAAAMVAVCVIVILYLSDLRRRSPWTGWPSSEPPPVPQGVTLSPEVEQGRQLYVRYGCNSCHAIAGHGRRIGPDLAQLGDRFSRSEYREYILKPPEGIPMPGYEGRVTEEELERIIDFVHTAQTFSGRAQ